jgi:O-antigen/teichoic acid export membrane protein
MLTQTQELREHRIGRATATLFGSNVLALTLQTLQFVLLARLLGVEEFARVAAANALITIAIPLAGLGYGNVLLMRVSTDRTGLRAYMGNAQLAIAGLGVCLVLAVTLLARLIYGGASNIMLVAVMATSELILVRSIVALGQGYQAIDRVEVTSGLNIGIALCRVAAIGFLMMADVHEATRWALVACGLFLMLACSVHLATARLLGTPRVAWRGLWSQRSEATHFALGTGAKALYTDLDKVFLGHCVGAAELGAYTAAYRLVVMAFLPVRSLLDASATQFYRRGAAGLTHSYGLTRHLLKVALPYGALAAGVMVAAAQWAPRVLGPSFGSATTVLYVLAPLPLIQAIHYAFSDALTAAGLQRVRSRLQWTTVCVYVGLAAMLIPAYGWRGAAAVCVVSEGLLAALVVLAVRNRVAER